MTLRIKTAAENAEVDYSLQRLLDTPNGLEKLALEKLPPFIREVRDYESYARKVLYVHQITEADTSIINGEPYIYYPKDLNSHAAIYGDDGEVTQLIIEGDGVYVGIFTIASDDTTINLKRLLVQKYNYVERVRELSGQYMGKAEDERLMALTDALVDNNTTQLVNSTSTVLSKDDLVELKKCITQWDLPTVSFIMNPTRLDDTLKWSRDELDELTRREYLEMGAKYKVWDILFITSRAVPANVVYAYSDKEFVGRMPVLRDISTKLTETPNKLEKGLFLFEYIGMYLASHKAVAKLILAT